MFSFCRFLSGLRRQRNASLGFTLFLGLALSLLSGAAAALTVSTEHISVDPTEVKEGDLVTVSWDSASETDPNPPVTAVTLLANELGVATNIPMEDPDADGVFEAEVTVALTSSTDTAQITVLAETDTELAAAYSDFIIVDNDPPVLSYGEDSVLEDGIEISGIADETATGLAEVSIQFSWDEGLSWATQGAATVSGAGDWTYTFQDDVLNDAEGLWFRAKAVDGVGNEAFGEMRALSKNLFLSILSPTGDWINAAEAEAGVLVSGQFDDTALDPALYDLTADILRLRIFHSGGVETRDISVSATITDSQDWEHFLNATKMGSLDDGSLVIKTVMTDENGNLTFAAKTLTLDTVPPGDPVFDAPLTENEDDMINAEEQTQGVTISGTVSGAEGQTLALEITDGSATVDLLAPVVDGAWSAEVTPGQIAGFADGELTLTASVTDAAGNAGNAATHTVQKITTPPTVTFADPLPGDANGDDIINIAEADAGFEVSGTANGEVEGQDVRVQIWVLGDEDSYRYERIDTAAADGAWSVLFAASPVNSLPEGTNHIYFRASVTDIAGNPSTVTETILSKDTQAPTISFNPVTGDNIINIDEQEAGVAISGSSSGANGRPLDLELLDAANQLVTLGPLTTSATNGDWAVALNPAQVTALADGEITLTAAMSDGAENAVTKTHLIIKNTSGPVVMFSNPLAGDDDAGTADSPYAGDGVINAAELAGGFAVNGNTDNTNGGEVNLKLQTLDGAWTDTYSATAAIGADGSWSHAFTQLQIAAISDGNDHITFRAAVSDAAGNNNEQDVLFSKDVTAPTLTITDIGGVACTPCNDYLTGDDLTGGLTVSGGATDNLTDGVEGQTVAVRILAGGIEQYTQSATVELGVWSVTFTQEQAESLPDGTLTFEADVVDWAGNPKTAAANIGKGAAALGVAITSPIADFVITGTTNSLPIDGTTTGLGVEEVALRVQDSAGNTLSRVAAVNADAWSLTLSQTEIDQLKDGALTITASVSDSGTDTAENSVSILKDTGIGTLESISSGSADGYYTAGQNINLTATLSQSVVEGSEITVTLNSGASVKLVAGTGGQTLSGLYLVQSGDAASRLNVTAITAVQLTDGYDNQTTALDLPPAGANLADNSNLVVYRAKLQASISRMATTDCPLTRNCGIGEAMQFKAKVWNAGPDGLPSFSGEMSFPLEGLGDSSITNITTHGNTDWVASRAVLGPRFVTLPPDSTGATHYIEATFGGTALATDLVQASVLIEHHEDLNYQETLLSSSTVNTRDTVQCYETKTDPASSAVWSGYLGLRATYITPVAIPMRVAIKDNAHALICGASSVHWDTAATGKIQVNDATCTGDLIQPASVPGTSISFINGGAEVQCSVRELDPDTRTIFLWGNCIDPANHEDRGDHDGDGFPNLYDNAPLVPNTSNACEATGGEVNITNKTYTEAYSCYAYTSRLVAAGRNVNIAAGSNVAYYSGGKVVLLPGFSAQAGSRFQAAIETAATRPEADPVEAESAASPASRRARSLADNESGSGSSANRVSPARVLGMDQLPAGLRRLLQAQGAELDMAVSDAQQRFVIFATGSALVSLDANGTSDVYLYHTADESLHLVSATALGTAGDGASTNPWLDGAGTYAVFQSEAGDLVSGDANQSADIFLLDLATGRLEALTPLQLENAAGRPMIASERPQVVFDGLDTEGQRRIFAYDYQWPNLGIMAVTQAQAGSQHSPAISADGRFVAYLQSRGEECRLWVLDSWQQTHHQLPCPAATAAGDYRPWFSEQAAELRWLPQAGTKEPAPPALDNPLH